MGGGLATMPLGNEKRNYFWKFKRRFMD